MFRYFFHVLNQLSYTRDEVGVELANLSAARRLAAKSAGEILTSDLDDGRDDLTFDIQIEDVEDVRLSTLRITADFTTGSAPAA